MNDKADEEIKKLKYKIDRVEKFYDELVDRFLIEVEAAYTRQMIDYKFYNIILKCFDRLLNKLKADLKVMTDRKVSLSIAKDDSSKIADQLDELNKVDLKCKWTGWDNNSAFTYRGMYETSCGKTHLSDGVNKICEHCKREVSYER